MTSAAAPAGPPAPATAAQESAANAATVPTSLAAFDVPDLEEGPPTPASSFDGTSSRRSFEIRTTPELRDFCVRLDAKLQPMGKTLHCSNYNSLLKPQKADYEPLFRTKVTIDESMKSPTKFFEAGTKRRMTDAEVSAIDWRECSFNVLLRISSIYVNSGTFGPVATPEAIVVKREDIFPEALDGEAVGQFAGLEMV